MLFINKSNYFKRYFLSAHRSWKRDRVYTCHECPSHYIGETESPFRKRVSEHKRDSSPVCTQSKITKHSFYPEHFKILDTAPRWHQRGIKEAIYIAARKPDLNKDLRRNPLPKAYKKLIKSCDLGLTSRSISRSCDSTRQTSTSDNQHQCWRSDLGWDTKIPHELSLIACEKLLKNLQQY